VRDRSSSTIRGEMAVVLSNGLGVHFAR
jgi:hypothetical protein